MGRHGTIAGRKEAQDKKRAAAFTKYVRLITVAAREGADPDYNVALKHAIEKAKSINMPNDNIQRAIKKGSGADGSVTYDSLNYEGYGPGGVAVIVEILTDNRNRTASSVKGLFDRCGGNVGTPGCVSYMFTRKGAIEIEKTDNLTEDDIMDVALDAGMDEITTYDDSFYITAPTENFEDVSAALREAGYKFIDSDITYVPNIVVENVSEADKEKLQKLIDQLEDNDDVQKVHHNCKDLL